MKEAEIGILAMPWANAQEAHLLSVCRMMTKEVGDGTADESGSDSYDQVMFTQNVETIEPFSSCMVPVKAGRAYTGECINIMVQALQTEDGSLTQGLTIQIMYTELRQGNKKGSHSGKEQYGLPTDPLEENPCGQGSCSAPGSQTTHGGSVTGGGGKPQGPHTPKLTSGKDMGNYSMNWI